MPYLGIVMAHAVSGWLYCPSLIHVIHVRLLIRARGALSLHAIPNWHPRCNINTTVMRYRVCPLHSASTINTPVLCTWSSCALQPSN